MAQDGNISQQVETDGQAAAAPSAAPEAQSAQHAYIDPREFLNVDKRIRRRVWAAGGLVTVVLVAVLVAATSVGIISGPNFLSAGSGEVTALTTHGFLELNVQAKGWDAETSTPAIMRVRSAESEEGDYLLCRAVPAGERDTVELDEGSYLISWITPVDADGALYIPPEGESLVNIRAGHTTSATATFKRVDPAESAFADYSATLDLVHEAIDHGDETLAGEVGEELLHKLEVNANEAPNFYIYLGRHAS